MTSKIYAAPRWSMAEIASWLGTAFTMKPPFSGGKIVANLRDTGRM
jgi:hypothetical protein